VEIRTLQFGIIKKKLNLILFERYTTGCVDWLNCSRCVAGSYPNMMRFSNGSVQCNFIYLTSKDENYFLFYIIKVMQVINIKY